MLGYSYSIQISKRKHSVTFVFSCLDISVKHSLSLFIYYVKMGKIHHFCNKICCQTSMFINSRIATIGKYCDVPVYSGKMSWYSVIFRHIPRYSAIFRDIPPYSVIFRHSGFSQRPYLIPRFVWIVYSPNQQGLESPWKSVEVLESPGINFLIP
jgi:hypothetical protein